MQLRLRVPSCHGREFGRWRSGGDQRGALSGTACDATDVHGDGAVYRGGADFGGGKFRVGNSAFQTGCEISHTESRGFGETSRTLAADTVDCGGWWCKISAGPRGFGWISGKLSTQGGGGAYVPVLHISYTPQHFWAAKFTG